MVQHVLSAASSFCGLGEKKSLYLGYLGPSWFFVSLMQAAISLYSLLDLSLWLSVDRSRLLHRACLYLQASRANKLCWYKATPVNFSSWSFFFSFCTFFFFFLLLSMNALWLACSELSKLVLCSQLYSIWSLSCQLVASTISMHMLSAEKTHQWRRSVFFPAYQGSLALCISAPCCGTWEIKDTNCGSRMSNWSEAPPPFITAPSPPALLHTWACWWSGAVRCEKKSGVSRSTHIGSLCTFVMVSALAAGALYWSCACAPQCVCAFSWHCSVFTSLSKFVSRG